MFFFSVRTQPASDRAPTTAPDQNLTQLMSPQHDTFMFAYLYETTVIMPFHADVSESAPSQTAINRFRP